MTYCPIEDRIYNIYKTVEDINKLPQTYETILKDKKQNKTLQLILRRKLNILSKEAKIQKTIIPKTRYGKVMFYIQPKDYTILFVNTRIGVDIYCLKEYTKLDKLTIVSNKYYILKGYNWKKGYAMLKINLDKVLKWI